MQNNGFGGSAEVYISGSGSALVIAQDDGICPFFKEPLIKSIPSLSDGSAARLHCLDVMSDTEKRTVLAELVDKYVVCGDVPVTLVQLSEDGFTVDDMIMLIKKLDGISG